MWSILIIASCLVVFLAKLTHFLATSDVAAVQNPRLSAFVRRWTNR